MAILLIVCSIVLTWQWFDSKEWLRDVELLFHQPQWLVFMFVVYLVSFLLKAAAWRIYTGSEVRFSIYFHAISYSLLVNHLLPVKAGDGRNTMEKPWITPSRICVIGRGSHLAANLRMLAL